jgi:hypothetical protein
VWLVSYVLADCKFMTVSSLPFGAGVVEEIEREWWSPPPEVVAGELTAERWPHTTGTDLGSCTRTRAGTP